MYIYIYIKYTHVTYVTEGGFEVKLPTIWTDGKAEVGRVREERVRRKKIKVREKVEQPQNTVLFHVLWLRRVEE